MAYTKNPTWTAITPLTVTTLNNLETMYDESNSYFTAHVHSNYYTKSEMDNTFWNAANDGPDSGADADLIYKSDGNLHLASFSNLGVVTGIIVLWYGTADNIPTGWHICDGESGTIDLVDKFVIGAGNSYEVGDKSDSTTFTPTGSIAIDPHILTVNELGPHIHPWVDSTPQEYFDGYDGPGSSGGHYIDSRTGTTSDSVSEGNGHGHSTEEGTSFSGNAVTCLPFYFSLYYIQKL